MVPEGLAAMPPGPALAAALGAIELDRVPNDRMLEVLAAQHRQLNHEQARMVATLAEVGRCETIPAPGLVARLSRPGRYAAEETRAALYWTRNAADSEHDFAESVVHAMPVVFAAWWSGDLDRPRVRVFDRYLTGLAPELIARICAVAVPVAPRRTTGQLARLLHRMVIAADPTAADRWYREGIQSSRAGSGAGDAGGTGGGCAVAFRGHRPRRAAAHRGRHPPPPRRCWRCRWPAGWDRRAARSPEPVARAHGRRRGRGVGRGRRRHRAAARRPRGGSTVRANLGPTCPHDHGVKHEGGWEVEQPEPGTVIWRSPLGGRYRSRGEFLDPPLPDPTATPTEPEEQHDRIRYDDGAILRRPPPEPTQERAPPPPTDPFEPPPF